MSLCVCLHMNLQVSMCTCAWTLKRMRTHVCTQIWHLEIDMRRLPQPLSIWDLSLELRTHQFCQPRQPACSWDPPASAFQGWDCKWVGHHGRQTFVWVLGILSLVLSTLSHLPRPKCGYVLIQQKQWLGLSPGKISLGNLPFHWRFTCWKISRVPEGS